MLIRRYNMYNNIKYLWSRTHEKPVKLEGENDFASESIRAVHPNGLVIAHYYNVYVRVV